MSDDKGARGVFCIRNQVHKPVEEHLACPYCCGKGREAVEAGGRTEFCDFDPDKDPVSFGFPEGISRALKG